MMRIPPLLALLLLGGCRSVPAPLHGGFALDALGEGGQGGAAAAVGTAPGVSPGSLARGTGSSPIHPATVALQARGRPTTAASPTAAPPTASPTPTATASAILDAVGTAAPTATPDASYAYSGGGGGGEITAPEGAGPVAVEGVVYRDAGDGAVPLAGARVDAGDGRSFVTGADGRYRLRGASPAALGVGAEGYLSSAVAGALPATLDLHLRPRNARLGVGQRVQPHRLRGTLVDEGGAPIVGAEVLLTGEDGSASVIARTDAAGAYVVGIRPYGETLADATLLAVAGEGEAVALAAREGIAVTGDADLGPTTARRADRVLRVRLDRPEGVPGGTMLLGLQDRHGARLAYASSRTGDARIAMAPGLRYGLQAAAADPGGGVDCAVELEDLPVPASTAGDALALAYLAPPLVSAAPEGSAPALSWGAIPGARDYRVELSEPGSGTPLAEAYLAGTTLPWPLPLRGVFEARVSAWDADGTSLREVASVPGSPLDVSPRGATPLAPSWSGPRALRLPPERRYRRSSRRLSLRL